MSAPSSVLPSGRLRHADTVRVAVSGLAAHRLRSAMTALGIAIGIAAMLSVVSISDASRTSLLSVLDRLGTNLLEVAPGHDLFTGQAAALPDDARSMIERVGPVESAASVAVLDCSVRRTDLISPQETGGISVLAADTDLLQTLRGSVGAGRFLDAATERYPTVVLGAVAASRLGIVDLGAPVQVWLGDQWFTVLGILSPMPLDPEIDRSALVGFDAARDYLGLTPEVSTIYVRARPDALNDVRAVLAATANPAHPEEVLVSRPSDAVEARAAAAGTFTGLLLGLGAVALLVGGLGVANAMLMAVLERRSEIGLRRALGATRIHIARQFVVESLVLAGLGGLAGVGIGSSIGAAYAVSQGWVPSLPLAGVAAAFVGSLLVGGGAGLYPALRAAALAPTEALRGG